MQQKDQPRAGQTGDPAFASHHTLSRINVHQIEPPPRPSHLLNSPQIFQTAFAEAALHSESFQGCQGRGHGQGQGGTGKVVAGCMLPVQHEQYPRLDEPVKRPL